MKLPITSFLTPIVAGLCLSLVTANDAKAANSYYFGTTAGITAGGTYSWDDANWGTASTGPFTSGWTSGGFARFYSANSYTVVVNNNELMSGLYQFASGTTLTITNGPSGGSLAISNGLQGFLLSGTTAIYAPITGVGGLEPEAEGTQNTLDLFGNNTYSGGTTFASASALTYFNNNNSFGTGTITIDETAGHYAPVLSTGGSAITLANNFANSIAGGGINFANSANTPVYLTGNWALGGNAVSIRNNGNSTASLTIGGVISGTSSASVTNSGANGGTIIYTNKNIYTGKTVIGIVGATNITVRLDTENAIAFSTNITITGGAMLGLDGFNQTNRGTLSLTGGKATIDFGADAVTLCFSNSSAFAWTTGSILNLSNWDGTIDSLQFGTDDTGLTQAQLSDIEFNGTDLGEAIINSDGFVMLPEPSSIALAVLGGVGMIVMIRRKTVGSFRSGMRDASRDDDRIE